jgi:hypothetical protein
MAAKSFFLPPLPDAVNFAIEPVGADLLDCPPVFEYTSVSNTRILTSSLFAITWSNPP